MTKIRGLQIKDADITVTQLADDAVETSKIKDLNVTLSKLESSVQTSLSKADSAMQSIAAGSITETELNASVNASLDLADSALQEIADNSITKAKMADNAIGAAEIDAGTETAGYVLTTDAVGGLSWTAKTEIAEDYIQEAEIQKASFTGDGTTVEFDVGDTPVTNSVQVYLNGLLQEEGSGSDYTLSGDKVTFATAPADGDKVQIHSIKT